ncbi:MULTISPECIES: hypothetical protein [Bradyrhizobium]|uniref:hypothetical protein n=1 Tax=Bradyrhizobium TaxID=374 RepID=UPI0005672E54|nr:MULTISPECIES: hypothetical protein [Bradyrhizobium]UFW45382.1 hypothetical protein BaraCB756_23935 [Bradyrhizobium arachidis]
MIDALMHFIERALTFEQLADEESNPDLKEMFESQAAAYRELAASQAQEMGLPPPSTPSRRLSPVAKRTT